VARLGTDGLDRVRVGFREVPEIARTIVCDFRFPSGSTTVTWQWPAKMYAHSAEFCQCISRTPPGLRYKCAPAMSVAIGKPLVVMSRAQPPEVALIGDLSPVRRGTNAIWSDAGATS
jgi:hypothetical protein